MTLYSGQNLKTSKFEQAVLVANFSLLDIAFPEPCNNEAAIALLCGRKVLVSAAVVDGTGHPAFGPIAAAAAAAAATVIAAAAAAAGCCCGYCRCLVDISRHNAADNVSLSVISEGQQLLDSLIGNMAASATSATCMALSGLNLPSVIWVATAAGCIVTTLTFSCLRACNNY